MLERAKVLGFLGPGPVEDHVEHVLSFVRSVPAPSGSILDLGSGGGVPGLVMAVLHWTTPRWVLLDAGLGRTAFLADAVRALGVDDRVQVVRARAEEAGRALRWRHRFDVVVARGFGPPAVTAECASPFLRAGGVLLVSEPPDGATDRWAPTGLAWLRLRAESPPPGGRHGGPSVQVLRQTGVCPGRFPRRVGVPRRRPLW